MSQTGPQEAPSVQSRLRRRRRAIPLEEYEPPKLGAASLLGAYRLRWKRRRYLWRAWRSRKSLNSIQDRTASIRPGGILVFVCLRNEMDRLPHFLKHYRDLGAGHFLIVDNGSDDGSREMLQAEPDVSLWHTDASYRASRFGMDWINHLLGRYGSGHWCLTVDADELFAFRDWERRGLDGLTKDLCAQGQSYFGALMLDLYPNGPLGEQTFDPGDDPLTVLTGFDPSGYRVRVQTRMGNLWIQGGPRARMFFRKRPERAPTINKTPLVFWHWRYAYVSSTHSLLPSRLNNWRGQENGLLLHTKFLPSITHRASVEKARGQHFGTPERFSDYYDALISGPDLWCSRSRRFASWRDAEQAGLLTITVPNDTPEIYRDTGASYVADKNDCQAGLDGQADGKIAGRIEAVTEDPTLGRD